MKVVKGIVGSILSFLLCLGLVAGFVVMLFSKTILNKEYLLKQMSENGYYARIEQDLKNGFEEYQYQSGFPEEVFEDLYSNEMVEEDIASMIDYLYDGKEMTNHASVVEEKITDNINQYLAENAISLTEKQEQNVDDFKKIIVSVYENKISVASEYMEQIAKMIEKIEEIISIVKIAIIGFLVFVIVIALLLNLKCFGAFLSTMGVSLLSSGILFELMNWVIVKNIDIENVLLLSRSLSDFVKELAYDILAKFNWFGSLFIAGGALLIIMGSLYKVKSKE